MSREKGKEKWESPTINRRTLKIKWQPLMSRQEEVKKIGKLYTRRRRQK